MVLNRRSWLRNVLAAGMALGLEGCRFDYAAADAGEWLRELEITAHGRLGVAALDTRTQAIVVYRAEERFPMCSTVKLMIAGAVLRHAMNDDSLLSRRIEYDDSDLAVYAPVTGKQEDRALTVAQLCAATLQYSDNAAANLLLRLIGGLSGVNSFARGIGDQTFRLDRLEPELNSAIPGDERDTTSPLAMMRSTYRLLLGDALGSAQREQLRAWMRGNTTGDKRIRAGVPDGWGVADKTGTGPYGTTNDVGVLWPPTGAPLVLAIYFTHPDPDAAPGDEIIAAATRQVVGRLR